MRFVRGRALPGDRTPTEIVTKHGPPFLTQSRRAGLSLAALTAYRFGQHIDLWDTGPNKNAVWHCACGSRGNFGMRQVVKPGFCAACKLGAAAKPADAFGRAPRSITASHCFGCGTSIGMLPGRNFLIIGACQTFRWSIATPTPQNALPRRAADAPGAISHLSLSDCESQLRHTLSSPREDGPVSARRVRLQSAARGRP